jgi:hypothetical protein
VLILLDIDGVMIPATNWKPIPILDDGFPQFNHKAISSLNQILTETNSSIVLTSSHKSKFSESEWENIFRTRSISARIQKLDDNHSHLNRKEEILNWLQKNQQYKNFVIIDDDKMLNDLPAEIKEKLVLTKSLIGLNDDNSVSAINI